MLADEHTMQRALHRSWDDAAERRKQEFDMQEFPHTKCGLGSCHPRWLQRFASKKIFVLILGLVGLASQAVNSYVSATISTIEKRFKIPSKTSGFISSFWDVGEITSLLVLGYLGSRGHKPRFVALGTLLIALSCMGRLMIHLVYGPGQDALELTKEYGTQNSAIYVGEANMSEEILSPCIGRQITSSEECNDDHGSFTIPTFVLFITSMCFGMGTSAYWTLGTTYMDDNMSKNKTPLALAASLCLRLLGPALGFAFATYALAIYVVPGATPLIDKDDPRWIGAWWLGWVPATLMLILFASLMALFPRQLPREAMRRARDGRPSVTQQLPVSFQDFRETLVRILRKPVFTLNSFSGVFFMLGYVGYGVFMPKYMETQYRQSASTASFISGSVGLIFVGLGILVSAAIITKWKPRARSLAAWSVMVELIDALGHFSWAFLNCGDADLHGTWAPDGSWNLTAACNAGCVCGPQVKYAPVCSSRAATTFYSPCHAGCIGQHSFPNGTMIYSDCACAPDGFVEEGTCPRDCTFNFVLFLASQCAMRFLEATGKAGNLLIQFRCVDEIDKTMSIAFSEFLLCMFAFIPGPILYGMLLDSTCLVWGEICGESGNCWVYDDRKLRYLLNFVAATCLFCGMFLDVGVWYYSKDMKIYDEDFQDVQSDKRRQAIAYEVSNQDHCSMEEK